MSNDRNRPTIDLRPLKFSVFECDQPITPEAQSFIDLRTVTMRKNGWRDIPDGEQDLDGYDELGASTVYLLLHTESGELLAGTRLSRPSKPVDALMSSQMWGDVPDAISQNEHLQSLSNEARIVDNTRLLLAEGASPEQILILLGAGFEVTDRQITPVFTITDSLRNFIVAGDVHMTEVHAGDIGGEGCVFGFFSPKEIFEESGDDAKALLNWGASLARGMERLFPVPSAPISSSTTT